MNPEPGRTGILGGTFDPVHLGHLAAAEGACEALGLDRVLLIPSHHPPHRPSEPRASAFHRFAMVSLAVQGRPRLVASDVELQRPGMSFTADTLRRLAEIGYRASQLFFITGTDAFAEVATWREYPAVLDLAHFVVISRPGLSFGALRARLPQLATRMHPAEPQGGSSREDRSIFLVDAPTPDVSSTSVRERVGRGAPLAGLVTPAVEQHILKHGLYGAPETPSGNGLA